LLQICRQFSDARFYAFFSGPFYDAAVAGFERIKSGAHKFFCGSVSEQCAVFHLSVRVSSRIVIIAFWFFRTFTGLVGMKE
jgi:hypothetical protein